MRALTISALVALAVTAGCTDPSKPINVPGSLNKIMQPIDLSQIKQFRGGDEHDSIALDNETLSLEGLIKGDPLIVLRGHRSRAANGSVESLARIGLAAVTGYPVKTSYFGSEMERDVEQGIKYLQAAGDHGYAVADWELYQIFRDGLHEYRGDDIVNLVSKNADAARYYVERAAKAGHLDAKRVAANYFVDDYNNNQAVKNTRQQFQNLFNGVKAESAHFSQK